MTEMVDDLKSNCIFLCANEAVYCKMMMIKRLNQEQYDKIIPLLGGFHMLLVKLKILHKTCGVLGLKEQDLLIKQMKGGTISEVYVYTNKVLRL